MEKKEFSIVALSRLKIDDLFSLIKSTITFADRVIESLGQLLGLILAKLISDFGAMEQQMNKAMKNVLTPQLTEMNADREDRYAEIKRNVTTAQKGRNEEKKSAAGNLKVFLDPFWDANKKSLNTQTELYYDMFTKFEASEALITAAATIGITEMMQGLAESNSAFNEVYQIRLEQEAAAGGPSATSLRAAATDSYNQFCTALEQTVNFLPTEVALTLFNQLEELRKTYARLVHDEDDDEKPTPPPAE